MPKDKKPSSKPPKRKRSRRIEPEIGQNQDRKKAAGKIASPTTDSPPVRAPIARAEQAWTEDDLGTRSWLYRHLVEDNLAGVLVADTEGRLLDCNDSLVSMFGYSSKEEMLTISMQLLCEDPGEGDRMIRLLRNRKVVRNVESRHRRKDGQIIWCLHNLQLIQNPESPQAIICTVIDITKQKQAQDELRESEARYRTVAETAADGLITIDESSRILFANNSVERIFGYPAKELIGQPLTLLMPEYLRHLHKHAIARYIATGKRHTSWNDMEVPGLHRSGREIPLELSFGESHSNQRHTFTGMIRDVSERKQALSQLRESEQRLRLALDASGISLWDCDVGTGKVYLSEGWAVILGGEPKATFTTVQDLLSIAHPDDSARLMQVGMQALKGDSSSCREQHRVRDIHGGWIWVESTGKVVERDHDGRARRMIGTNASIGERKEAEAKLREFQDRLRHTVNNAPLVLFAIDDRGVFQLSEGRGLAALGLAPGQVVGQSLTDVYGDNAGILSSFRRALSGEEFMTVHTVPSPNLTFETVWMPLRNLGGEVVGVNGVATDITEREKAERAFRESEERLRLALNAAQMGVWEWDAATNRTTWGMGLHQILGVKPGEFDGTIEAFAAMIHPEDRAKFLEAVEQTSRTGELHELEFRVVRPDGRTVWIADQGRAELDASGKVIRFRGVSRDVSQQRVLKEQLNRAQRMEAVGLLAGGIAHDFNNLLTVIRGHAEILLERSSQDPSTLRDAVAIQKAADRAATITKQLLAFGRKQILQPRVLDLRAVVAEISDMLRKLIGSNIALNLNMGGEALWMRADEGQIEQVVVNLVVNARDAMPHGGELTLEASRVVVGPNFVREGTPMPEGNYSRLSVRDTGFGMDAATQARIFEPFFTTKAAGKGTGLGLATVYGIVKQSGGWIWVESEIGQGTRFELFLPEAPASGKLPDAAPVADHGERGTETILVVDDEEAVRDLAAACLRSQGYTVLLAPDGNRAIEVAEGYRGPIHALIADAMMAGMDGVTVARRVARLRPGIKVLYVSGYAGASSSLDEVIARGEAFLQKPFTLDSLTHKLREILA